MPDVNWWQFCCVVITVGFAAAMVAAAWRGKL